MATDVLSAELLHTHTHTQLLMQIQSYSLIILAFVYIESSLITLAW